MKREFLQLAKLYDGHQSVNRWFVSEKLDGFRAFWDGGISRGMLAKDIPWSNTVKDTKEIVATGMWSRLGKVIWSPSWWLDKLPTLPMDGELYLGPGQFQELMSICKNQSGESDWSDVTYQVFDSPPLDVVFADGILEVRVGNEKYKRTFLNAMDWVNKHKHDQEQKFGKFRTVKPKTAFEDVLRYLREADIENKVVRLVEQTRLPMANGEVAAAIERHFGEALEKGCEGIIIRAHHEFWVPERTRHMLKLKPRLDSEAVVEGYVWGHGKHFGRMGCMLVRWGDKRFELAGFTDKERILTGMTPEDIVSGKLAGEHITNPMFPKGKTINFMYRELTDGGLPKEAFYHRLLIG